VSNAGTTAEDRNDMVESRAAYDAAARELWTAQQAYAQKRRRLTLPLIEEKRRRSELPLMPG
jgi:hypothetical protein